MTRRHAAIAIALGLTCALSACGQASPTVRTTTAAPITTPLASGPKPSAARRATVPPARSARVSLQRSDIRLPSARSRAVALAFGSAILVCGGLTSDGTTTGSIVSMDLQTGRVSEVGALAAPVHDAGGAVLDGSGFIFGGGMFGPGSVVQRVGPTSAAITVGHLPASRADLAAVAVDGELIVVGGGTPDRPDDRALATIDGRSFRIVARLLVGVRYPAVAAIGGWVYAIGGSTPSGDTRVIQAFDPRTGVVRIVGRLAHALSHASAFVVGGALLIAGGRAAGRAQDAIWRLDVATGIVTNVGRLPYPVSDMAAVVVDGVGYLIGGEAIGPLASVVSVTVQP